MRALTILVLEVLNRSSRASDKVTITSLFKTDTKSPDTRAGLHGFVCKTATGMQTCVDSLSGAWTMPMSGAHLLISKEIQWLFNVGLSDCPTWANPRSLTP